MKASRFIVHADKDSLQIDGNHFTNWNGKNVSDDIN